MARGETLRGRSVLLIEDDGFAAGYVAAALVARGSRIAGTLGTIAEALAALREADLPAVAMLDISLRGEPAWPVAEELTRRGVPFVLLGTHGDTAVPPRFQAVPRLPRPFAAHQVLDELALLLGAGD